MKELFGWLLCFKWLDEVSKNKEKKLLKHLNYQDTENLHKAVKVFYFEKQGPTFTY